MPERGVLCGNRCGFARSDSVAHSGIDACLRLLTGYNAAFARRTTAHAISRVLQAAHERRGARFRVKIEIAVRDRLRRVYVAAALLRRR